jgi:hypothetical protein
MSDVGWFGYSTNSPEPEAGVVMLYVEVSCLRMCGRTMSDGMSDNAVVGSNKDVKYLETVFSATFVCDIIIVCVFVEVNWADGFPH